MVTDAVKLGEPNGDKGTVRYTVLSHRAIAVWAVFVLAAGVGMAVWLLLAYGTDGDARVQLDAIRTAGTTVVGAGGAAALLLAARRQRSIEIALRQTELDQHHRERVAAETRTHQERVAAATEHDAVERRVTELYTAAAAQLGSDKAPVRLAGLYALERLAQDNPTQRQTVVNVLCAYLRMPWALPADPSDVADDQDQTATPMVNISIERARVERLRVEGVQEREVRLTAQRVLIAHLRPGDGAPTDTHWADTDLNLTGAVLITFDLHDCHLRSAQFTQATFVGDVAFGGAEFGSDATFDEAEFAGKATFDGARFASNASFDGAEFAGEATFIAAEFAGNAKFVGARFADNASFDEATFARAAWLLKAEFGGTAWFARVKFAGEAVFDEVKVVGFASFANVDFADKAWFDSAMFLGHASFGGSRFAGHTSFGDSEEFSETSFSRDVSFGSAVFEQGVPTAVKHWCSPPSEGEA